jgi:nicotinamidase-related amidase
VQRHIWAGIAPVDDEVVILKPSCGAFYDTSLETILKNLQKHTVIICGTLTNYCCGTTARQAYERGFQVVFGADVTATDDPEMQEPELRVIRKGFGRVMTGDEIIGALQYRGSDGCGAPGPKLSSRATSREALRAGGWRQLFLYAVC